MSSGKFLYFISQAQCRYYFRKMDINDPPPSHPGFVNLVKRLTTSGRNSNDVIKFLKYYGTHYLSEVTLGARFLKKLEVSQTNYEEFRTKKISVEAQANYSGLGTKICRHTNFQKSVETDTITVEVALSNDGSGMTWSSSAV